MKSVSEEIIPLMQEENALVTEYEKLLASAKISWGDVYKRQARELTRAFCDDEFTGFTREKRLDVTFVCFTEYDPTIPNKEVAFHKAVSYTHLRRSS